jgi:HNH endonuclease
MIGIALPVDRIAIKYAATYYFLSQLDQLVAEDLILDRYLSDYFEAAIWDYITPFQKWTALHMFSSVFIDMVLGADFDRAAESTYVRRGSCTTCCSYPGPAAHLLAADLCHIHAIEASTLDDALRGWVSSRACCPTGGQSMITSDLEDAWTDWRLEESHDRLLEQIAEEMFFVLFANRSLLRRFNLHMALRIGQLSPDESNVHLLRADSQGNTRLVRAQPPEWAKRAVFFRDRGYCCACGRNLENSRSPINSAEFDHIVPLAAGGMNDVTNLQLLCKSCNGNKRAQVTDTSDLYERWYPTDRKYGPRTPETLESVVLRLSADGFGS